MKFSEASFPFNFAQAAFEPSAGFRNSMRQSATNFWHGQDQVLEAMEDYANGWFERRHVGTQAALDAAQQIISATTPVEAMRAYQRWALGSFERMFNDGLSCHKQLMSMGSLMAPPLSPSGDKSEAETRAESRQKAQSRIAA